MTSLTNFGQMLVIICILNKDNESVLCILLIFVGDLIIRSKEIKNINNNEFVD